MVDTYRSTPAFMSRMSRTSEADTVLDKLRWKIFPGDESRTTVKCQGQEQFEMVREQLADAHIELAEYDTQDWSLTVKKADLQCRFPHLFEGPAL
jgi:hypothetical protein